jgi:hypothetical protein
MSTTNESVIHQTEQANTTEVSATPISVDAVRAKVTNVVNSIIDFGAIWANAGLGHLRVTVEGCARALERTAKHLETYQERFKRPESKPAA